MLSEREEALTHEEGFEECRDYSRNDARDDPDQYVVRSPPHHVWLRVATSEFFVTRESAVLADRSAFERFAETFARTLRAGDVVALSGDLGAGKTTFVAAAVRELSGRDEVTSPTFTFRQTYVGPPLVEHIDCYRVDDVREASELGLHEAFESDAIAFVEWPERLPDLVPERAIRLAIGGAGDAPRTIAIERP